MDLIGKNGKIDGILAAQVLLDGGVFFFKPGELYYDGTYHQVKGMQANTTAMRDFPGIFDKMDTLAPELVNLMVYIEKNTMFRVKLEDLGEEIIMLINGRHVAHLGGIHAKLLPGDVVSIFPVVAGG